MLMLRGTQVATYLKRMLNALFVGPCCGNRQGNNHFVAPSMIRDRLKLLIVGVLHTKTTTQSTMCRRPNNEDKGCIRLCLPAVPSAARLAA